MMRALVWIFFVLAIGLVGILALKVLSRTTRDPHDNIARAQRLWNGAEPDLPAALAELEYALRIARAEEEPPYRAGPYHDLIGEILASRGQLYAELDMFGLARTDLEIVLNDFRPDDIQIQVLLASVLLESEEIDAAMLLLTDVLSREPTRADAWALQSRSLVQRAREKLGEAAQQCQAALPDRQARHAATLLKYSSGLPLTHPRRVMMLHRLRELFGPLEEANVRNALALADRASEYVSGARTALAESFLGHPSRESLQDYLTLLDHSGRNDLTIDFGLAAINESTAQRNPVFVRMLMQSLLERDRPRTAVELVNHYYERGIVPDRDFYSTWAEALYRDQRWDQLGFVGPSMLRASTNDGGRSMAAFYVGISLARQGEYAQALPILQRFTGRVPVEPVPGALALAFTMLARCHREEGHISDEKAALHGALRLAPEDLEHAGEAWLRLSELIEETEKDSLLEALEALTHSMRLAPESAPRLMEHWSEIRAELLSRSRTELELVYERLVDSGRIVPEGRLSPYELYQLTRRYRADRRPAGVAACARKLLNAYPGFPPALDLCIEAALEMNDHEEAARLLYARALRAGPDAETLAALEALPAELIDGERQLLLMKLDPEHVGRLAIVRGLREAGRPFDALVGLEHIPDEELDDRSRYLKAAVARDLGRWGLARDTLAGIPPESPFWAPALQLRLEAAVGTHDREDLGELIELVTASEAPDVDALIGIADRMMLGGSTRDARTLLQRLDERDDTRSGRVMLRLGMAAWLDGDTSRADEHIARAEAFQTDGGPQIGLLIRAADAREWSELRWLVAELQSSDFTPSLLQAAVLDVLREDTLGARQLVTQGRERAPDEALWQVIERALDLIVGRSPEDLVSDHEAELLHALLRRGSEQGDPRQLLVRLLAFEHPDWTAFVTAEFGRARVPNEGSLWSAYLAARGLELLGDMEAAERRARDVLEHWEAFGPAWELVERAVAATLDRPDRPQLLLVQQQHRRARGIDDLPATVRDLRVRARILSEDGEHEDALLAIAEALKLAPEDPESLLVLAQLQRKAFLWRPAVLALSQACEQRPPVADDYIVKDFLELIHEVQAAAPDLSNLLRTELLKLNERFADDPLVVLELARSDLDGGALTPEMRLARALERLEDYLVRIEGRPLESLRAGATEAWVDFYLERDPQLAAELVQRQLELLPESADMWRMLGRTQAALGERTAAIETYETLLRMLPDGRTSRAVARLVAQTGEDHDRVRRLVASTARLDRAPGGDLELQLIQARSYVNDLKTPRWRDQGIVQLEKLWEKREQRATTQEQLVELGELYGLALAWRQKDARSRRIANEVLLEIEPQIDDPARRNVIRAVANLAGR